MVAFIFGALPADPVTGYAYSGCRGCQPGAGWIMGWASSHSSSS